MNIYSEIAKSALIKSPEGLEHPVHLGPGTQVHACCKIGQFSFLNAGTTLFPHVNIGKFCSIARNCEIGAANHPTNFLSSHTFQYQPNYFPKYPDYVALKGLSWRSHAETNIGNDVWIGAKCIIKSGITIGDGAIVAAGAVVTKDVLPYSIVGGVPAKLIRMRFDDVITAQLLELKWWNMDISHLKGLPFDNITECIKRLNIIKNITKS